MSNVFSIEPAELRAAIATACEVTATIDDPGKVADALVSLSQAKALDYKTSIVRGGRGSGKSFWWAALQKEKHRSWITNTLGAKLSRAENLEVIPGFGVAARDAYPSPRVLGELAKTHSAHLEDIWTTVLLKQAFAGESSPYAGLSRWADYVGWTASHIEEVENLIRTLAGRLEQNNAHLLIAFDGLDRLASNWEGIRPLAQSVLRFALQLQSYSRIRAKVFLRPDMHEDSHIVAFPDASKLLDGYARLDWNPVELYALFFQRLANAQNELAAQAFRDGATRIVSNSEFLRAAWERKENVWELPSPLKVDAKAQREVFHAITGGAMGHNQNSVKRGYPYTWLPNHLADSHGEISPRSFLSALRQAAAVEPPSNTSLPLYFTGIQHGVSAASETRVSEITEDYPWVGEVMKGLNGQINVPCEQSEIFTIWKEKNVISAIASASGSDTDASSVTLGPTTTSRDPIEGIFEDLIRLGIFSRQDGTRVQMPDVYRVAFGIGRKGGIPPIRKARP